MKQKEEAELIRERVYRLRTPAEKPKLSVIEREEILAELRNIWKKG